MRRILVKSLNEAFDFVMDHYYPAGCEEDAKRKDTYAVISIQDKVFNAGGVKFKVREVSGKTLVLTFFRKYREGEIDWLNYDPKLIYNIDANIITGHSFNGFRIPDYWGGVPFGYTFFMSKREFIGCYKNSAVMLGADQVDRVKITAQPEKVVMRLTF